MDPKSIFDSAALIAAAGGATMAAVQLVKYAAGGSLTPRAIVGVAATVGGAMTALYAFSNGLFAQENAFGIVAAWFAIVTSASGIQAIATTTTRSS